MAIYTNEFKSIFISFFGRPLSYGSLAQKYNAPSKAIIIKWVNRYKASFRIKIRTK